jgi:salicylate hydroxylase
VASSCFANNQHSTLTFSLCTGFNQTGSRAKLIRGFEHMCPAARKIVSLADSDVKVWVLYDMQSLPTWTRQRLVLIGDAAHPFLPCTKPPPPHQASHLPQLTNIPVLGQGGAMAIEDAVCIARLLPKTTSASEVEGRLECYEEIRYKRVEYVRDETRKNGLDEDERSSGGMLFHP